MTDTLTRHGWIRRGLVWHNPAAEANRHSSPAEVLYPIPARRNGRRLTSTCLLCEKPIMSRFTRCRECHKEYTTARSRLRSAMQPSIQPLEEVLARTLAANSKPSCYDCGCLLSHADESCPWCVWIVLARMAKSDAVRTSWRRPMEMAA